MWNLISKTIPTFASLFEKYGEDGFTIYSVSLDDERAKWQAAMEEDGRIWPNVSTLQGFETPATFEYAVTSLPSKFIVDSEGRILAKGVHGEELRETIEKLIKDQNW